jgi:hypothetical protein
MQASTADEHPPAHATGITAAEESIHATGDIAHAGWLKHAARLANWEDYLNFSDSSGHAFQEHSLAATLSCAVMQHHQ